MRVLVVLFSFIISLLATPLWFGNLEKTKPYLYIGYGVANSLPQAKREALNDISSQIFVKIDSSFKDEIEDKDGVVTTLSKSSSQQKSNSTLNDYKLLKMEFQDGKYFIAIEYENIPSLDKFIGKIKDAKTEKQNSYLKNSLVAKNLKKSLKVNIDFKLHRQDKKWFIQYNSILQPLDTKDFLKFFTYIKNPLLEIKLDKKQNILYDGDEFFFKVKSLKKGFISIITVYEDGTVATLVKNIAVEKGSLENIPDKDFETIPEAGILEEGVESIDLYILLYSQKKLRFDSFTDADDEVITEEKYKNFDELIEFIDDKSYATLKVVTKPR